MFDNIELLYFQGSSIVNTNNDIIYNGGSYEFIITTLKMSINKLSRMLCDRLG